MTARRKKEGRFARHLGAVQEVRREPRSAVRMLRAALLRLWQARGGGFYGLGYVVTFIVLEAKLITGEFLGSESFLQFVTSEILEHVFRFGILSLVSGVLALIWPAFVLSWLGVWGFAVLLGGYFAFEHAGRPVVERWFPEIREARETKERKRAEDANDH
ncbi:MAG: hypothetical protein H0W33_07535 [Gammaproteobacteria bacterium]|nr:hypothetical protein [Gammaproteobacteria bacterium]